MKRIATIIVTPSIAARMRYGTPRFVTWAMSPPETVPTSIATPPTTCARPKTCSRCPVKPGRLERVDEPRLGRAGEEREPEAEEDRGDRPAPQRRVDLPHDEVQEGRHEEGGRAEHVREPPAARVGDDAGRHLEDHLADGEERVGGERLGVAQARRRAGRSC